RGLRLLGLAPRLPDGPVMRAGLPIAALAVLMAGCSHPGAPRASEVQRAASRGIDYDPELLRTLSILATRHEQPAAELAPTQSALASGRLTIGGYIDSLVARPEFAATVAPLVILRHLLSEDALSAPSRYVLSKTAGSAPIYYLGGDPCKPAQTVRVRPWWDL